MTLLEAIPLRHSVRNYTPQPIEADKVAALNSLIDKLNAEGRLNLRLVTGDSSAFNTRLARYGKFAGVSNYIALMGPKDPGLDERLGYYGERVVLTAQTLGLNTCWVGMTYSKHPAGLQVPADRRLRGLVALGYGTTTGQAHRVKAYDRVARAASPTPQWFVRGVEAALLAPTAMNQQKFSFILLPDNRVQARTGLGFFTKIDLGIAKLHFELAAAPHRVTWSE